jgi:pilus assembly protein CpaC
MTKTAHSAQSGAKKGPAMKRLAITLLTAAAAVAPIGLLSNSAANAQSLSRPANDVLLSIGRGQLVSVAGTMADVFVADDKVADVQVKSAHQLYVFGKAGGETTIYASNAAGDVIWSANVRVGSNIDSVDQMLHMAMPDAKISVSTMGTNTFLLTGTVAAPEDAAEAQRLVQAFTGKDANVITRLKLATPLQVNLHVKFAEVSRSLIRDIGTNLTSVDSSGGFKFGIGQGTSFKQVVPTVRDPLTGAIISPQGPLAVGPNYSGTGYSIINQTTTGTTLGFASRLAGLDILGALDLGESVGLVSTLSEPNLTALSGETADFLAGGEYPIPISQGLGTTSIEYKRFGVSLSYTPTVLSNGRISMRVRPEVSELSSQGAVTLNGFQVPALTIRRAETTVELGSGQSFMIAGLMSNNSQSTLKKMPGAGDLPILGSLFRSTHFQKGETELVIIVTPYLVNPVDANDIKLPTDGFKSANVGQQMFGNMQTDGKSGGDRPKPTSAPQQNPNGPQVGDAYAPARAPAPQTASGGDKDNKKKKSKGDSDASPGFSLN